MNDLLIRRRQQQQEHVRTTQMKEIGEMEWNEMLRHKQTNKQLNFGFTN